MTPGKRATMVSSRSAKARPSAGDTAVGSRPDVPGSIPMRTRASATVARAWAMTSSTDSPGRMRKLTTALARSGRTLDFVPPWITVAAVVVRIAASSAGRVANVRSTRGSSTSALARASLWRKGSSGARASRVARVGSDQARGWAPGLQAAHGLGHDTDHALGRRHRRVAARRLGRQLEADRSLLGHPDQCDRAEPGEHAVGDDATLVEDQVCAHASRREFRGDGPRAGLAPDLLVVTDREQQRAPRGEALSEQVLHGGEDGDEAALVVEGAAAPHLAARHRAGERGLAPRVLGARIDGHDVLVGHEDDRRQPRCAAAPGVEQAPVAHAFALEGGVDAGKQLTQLAVQGLEGLGRRRRLARPGDRPVPDRPRQCVGDALGVHGCGVEGGHVEAARERTAARQTIHRRASPSARTTAIAARMTRTLTGTPAACSGGATFAWLRRDGACVSLREPAMVHTSGRGVTSTGSDRNPRSSSDGALFPASFGRIDARVEPRDGGRSPSLDRVWRSVAGGLFESAGPLAAWVEHDGSRIVGAALADGFLVATSGDDEGMRLETSPDGVTWTRAADDPTAWLSPWSRSGSYGPACWRPPMWSPATGASIRSPRRFLAAARSRPGLGWARPSVPASREQHVLGREPSVGSAPHARNRLFRAACTPAMRDSITRCGEHRDGPLRRTPRSAGRNESHGRSAVVYDRAMAGPMNGSDVRAGQADPMVATGTGPSLVTTVGKGARGSGESGPPGRVR